MSKKTIAVIGAVNIDILGTSEVQPVLHDSNPGNVNISFGGVGRNIAENLCHLGFATEMITTLAEDDFSRQIVEAGKKIGIGFSHSMIVPGASCSTYISVNSDNKDMLVAINDMKICDRMTIDFIRTQIDFINSCDIAVCDTNMPANVLRFLAENCTVPLAVDPVSMIKALKLQNIIGRFTIIKPNVFESEFMTGIKAENDLALKQNADFYHSLGVKYVFISLAEKGCFFSDGEKCGIMPICSQYQLVNASGCGDAIVAAVVWQYLNGGTVEQMAKAGVCAASVCGNSKDTVCPDINEELLLKLMKN